MSLSAQLQAFARSPRGKRVLVGGGATAAAGAGLYARHKARTRPAGSSSPATAPVANPGALDGNPHIYVVMTPTAGYPPAPPQTTPPGTTRPPGSGVPTGAGGRGSYGQIRNRITDYRPPSSSTGGATPNPYSEQSVRDLFAQFGFTSPAAIAGATYGPSTESAEDRIARITRQLNDGDRSITDVTRSISQLPGSPSRGVA